jgi:hypothetical protein
MHVIRFNPVSELAEMVVKPPRPASEYIPQWYRDSETFKGGSPSFRYDGVPDLGLKMCHPFRDSLFSGYIQESWQDIYISADESGEMTYAYRTQPGIISVRDRPNLPIGQEFYPKELTINPQWTPQLPRGWSMLYTSPFNRVDLPLVVLSGIVDHDKLTHFDEVGNLPFYLKSDFSGILPKGTPLYQMIPIKREAWISVAKRYNEKEQLSIQNRILSRIWGGYKKEFWTRKEFS